MMDLNSLSLVGLPAGVVLESANGINNAGQVIATAIPEPEVYALFLAGLALVGFIARRKKRGICLGVGTLRHGREAVKPLSMGYKTP